MLSTMAVGQLVGIGAGVVHAPAAPYRSSRSRTWKFCWRWWRGGRTRNGRFAAASSMVLVSPPCTTARSQTLRCGTTGQCSRPPRALDRSGTHRVDGGPATTIIAGRELLLGHRAAAMTFSANACAAPAPTTATTHARSRSPYQSFGAPGRHLVHVVRPGDLDRDGELLARSSRGSLAAAQAGRRSAVVGIPRRRWRACGRRLAAICWILVGVLSQWVREGAVAHSPSGRVRGADEAGRPNGVLTLVDSGLVPEVVERPTPRRRSPRGTALPRRPPGTP